MLYLIAWLLFIVLIALCLIIRRLDTIIALCGGRVVVVDDGKTSLPPSNVYSRHDELIKQWKKGG